MTADRTVASHLELIGRDNELGDLLGLLDHAAERGSALVVSGEAGIGKSSLVKAGLRDAKERGYHVLTTAGIQSETNLPFAGLHQLLRPVLGDVEHLPPPQKRAVEAAFGLVDEPAPGLFLIALAALHLLSDVAARAPLLVVVEDGHWLDRPTTDVLTFVARRLESDPLLMLVEVRDGYNSPFLAAGIKELHLDRLAEASAAALLDETSPGLGLGVRTRVLNEAAGNPLALVELPLVEGMVGPAMRASAQLPPLTNRLEEAFSARADELPEPTRTALLVAAADDRGLLGDVLSAANLLAGTAHDDTVLLPAIQAGLVELEHPHLRFRHPLMRSAIYQAANAPERAAAHRVLSKVFADEPDRRAWHLAASALGPDEAVAGELEDAADRALRRGATATAIDALRRAATTSVTPTAKAKRLLRAAELGFDVGLPQLIKDLVAEAESLEMDEPERLRLILVREFFDDGVPADADRVQRLVRFADQTAKSDTELALGFLRAASVQAWWSDADEESKEAVVAGADKLRLHPDDPRVVAIKAIADPDRQGGIVIDQLSRFTSDDPVDPGLVRLYGQAATAVGDVVRAARFMEDASAGLRRQGRLGLLAPALAFLAWGHIRLGDFTAAASAADEALRLARETDQPRWVMSSLAAEGMVAAVRGETDLAERLALEAEALALPTGLRGMISLLPLIRGMLAVSAGRYEEAYRTFRRPFEPGDPACHSQERWRALGYLAEAAAHGDNYEDARRVLNGLEPIAAMTPALGVQVPMNYARAVLAEGEDAEPLFNSALAANLSSWPFERARLLLAYGQWLRRQRRLAESRTPLRTACDTFDAVGAVHWAEQARKELRAAGETSRKAAAASWDALSPQELQIARMAAEGLSNREIGQQLYLSHRTVSSHLYRIFPKLGITSRAQLHQALARLGIASPHLSLAID